MRGRAAEKIRARAMETLFERLENLCEGALAIDRCGHIVYVNEKYLPALGLRHTSEAIGRPVEEIIPNSLMRNVAESGEQYKNRHVVKVTIGLRPSAENEEAGLDESDHGESGYHYDEAAG